MQRSTFERRMQLLRDWGAEVLPLESALERMAQDTLPEKAVVITIDDGWFGTYDAMWPVLREFGFPATLYVCSYYIEHSGFVFNMFVDYALRTSTQPRLALEDVAPGLTGHFDLRDPSQRSQAREALVRHGEDTLTFEQREALCTALADTLGVDSDSARAARLLQFMNGRELAALAAEGLDLQLHTHTHRFSTDDPSSARDELARNQAYLADFDIARPRHFCYPSGRYAAAHAEWLRELGIASATTTDFGLASRANSPYYLPRICDSEAMPEIDFMAAVTGFKDLVSTLRR